MANLSRYVAWMLVVVATGWRVKLREETPYLERDRFELPVICHQNDGSLFSFHFGVGLRFHCQMDARTPSKDDVSSLNLSGVGMSCVIG